MIVYGSNRKRYVLSSASAWQDQNGAIYYAEHEPDIMVKIYHQQYRTPETERDVIDAINGVRSMLNEIPQDIVYMNGRFAGYIFQQSGFVPQMQDPSQYSPPIPTRQPAGRTPLNPLTVLISIGVGIALSALEFFVLFDILKWSFGEEYAIWNFKGIPMIIGGWIAMIVVLSRSTQDTGITIAFAALGFFIGSIAVFLITCALVYMFSFATSVMKALLPTIIVVGIVVLLIKTFFRR